MPHLSRFWLLLIAFLSLPGLFSLAQDPNQPPNQATQQPGSRLRGRGGWGGGGMGAFGRGVIGTVTGIAPDHFTVRTENGDTFTILYSANTRIMKRGGGTRRNTSEDDQPSFTPPQTIKAAEIKIGDAIAATGEMDSNARSVGAVVIFQIDPERAKEMREMQANYGKTWLMGRITAINEVKITLQGGPDSASHTFIADENTSFRKRREPITLADVQVGDLVRAEGSIKDGNFVASSVAVMSPPTRGPASQNGDSRSVPQ